jgi:hypothetical protein
MPDPVLNGVTISNNSDFRLVRQRSSSLNNGFWHFTWDLIKFIYTYVLIVVTLGKIVASIVILVISSDVINGCNDLWIYILTSLLYTTVALFCACCYYLLKAMRFENCDDSNYTKLKQKICLIIFDLPFDIWTIVIYYNLQNDNKCYDYYDSNYSTMLNYYIILFYFGLILVFMS